MCISFASRSRRSGTSSGPDERNQLVKCFEILLQIVLCLVDGTALVCAEFLHIYLPFHRSVATEKHKHCKNYRHLSVDSQPSRWFDTEIQLVVAAHLYHDGQPQGVLCYRPRTPFARGSATFGVLRFERQFVSHGWLIQNEREQ